MDVFVSYARADVAAVRRLTEDIELGGHQVWFDRDLHGGDDWWARILERIRTCSVLVFALSNYSLRSQACRAELDYAEALGVAVIPIQVGMAESLSTTPVARYQVIDGRERSTALGYQVMSAIALGAARRGPPPDPLPPEPEVPFAYLNAIGRQVARPALRSTEQAAVIGQLRHALRDEDDEDARADARRLLTELRRHPECTYANAQEIDEILDGPASGSGAAGSRSGTGPEVASGSDTASDVSPGIPAPPAADTEADSMSSPGSGHTEGPVSAPSRPLTSRPAPGPAVPALPAHADRAASAGGGPTRRRVVIAAVVGVVLAATGLGLWAGGTGRGTSLPPSPSSAPARGYVQPPAVVGAAIPIPTPVALAVSPDGGRVYVIAANGMSVIDTGSGKVVGSPVEVRADPAAVGLPAGAALSPDGSRLYVTDWSGGSVSVIDTGSSAPVGSPIRVGACPNDVAVSPDGDRVYVANRCAGSVSVIDARSNATEGSPIKVGAELGGLAVSPDGSRLYGSIASSEMGSVAVIDADLRAVVGSPNEVVDPGGLAVSPVDGRVYVTSVSVDTVTVIDPGSGAVVGSPIAVGDGPWGAVVSPDGERVYVVNGNEGSVSVIDARSGAVMGPPIALVRGHLAGAVSPDGRRLYVSNDDANSVSVIDTGLR